MTYIMLFKILTVSILDILGIVFGLLIGFFFGAAIFALIYVLLFVKSLKNSNSLMTNALNDEKKAMAIILKDEAILEFKDKTLRGKSSYMTHSINICKNLAIAVANIFNPNERYSYLSISIAQADKLILYVEKRLNEILNRPVIRLLKKFKLSTIFSIEQTSTKFTKSKFFKKLKSANGIWKYINGFLHIINPLWWFRKLIIDNTIKIITKKLCITIINIVGEEAYKIYSMEFEGELDIEQADKLLENEEIISTNSNKEKYKSYGLKNKEGKNYESSFNNSLKFKEKKIITA